MKNLFFILVVLAVVGGAVYLLVTRPQRISPPSQSNTNIAPPKTEAEASNISTSTKSEEAIKTAPAQEKISSVEVKGFEFGFDPHIIGLEVGEKIKLTFKNTGKMSHNWVLEGTGIRTKVISSGQTDVIEFTAPAKGTYKFYCSISGHRQAGMEGTLMVN